MKRVLTSTQHIQMLFFSGLMITVDLSEKYLHLLLKDIKVIEYFRAQLVLFSRMCFYLGIGILGRLQRGKNIIKTFTRRNHYNICLSIIMLVSLLTLVHDFSSRDSQSFLFQSLVYESQVISHYHLLMYLQL